MKKAAEKIKKRRTADEEAAAVADLVLLEQKGVPRNSAIAFVRQRHKVPYRVLAEYYGLTEPRVLVICTKTPAKFKTPEALIEHFASVERIAARMAGNKV